MSRRSGFTLLEVVVSIVLTAVISLLVYGAAQAARDTDARIRDQWHSLHAALTMRLLLGHALAGAQTSFIAADSMIVLENRVNARGTPQDRLTFVTSGDMPPLSPGADWIVTFEPTPQGLDVLGRAVGTRTPNRILAQLPGVTGLAIRVKDAGSDAGWSPEWNFPAVLPNAVELTYWTDSGRVGVPLTVSVALGGER